MKTFRAFHFSRSDDWRMLTRKFVYISDFLIALNSSQNLPFAGDRFDVFKSCQGSLLSERNFEVAFNFSKILNRVYHKLSSHNFNSINSSRLRCAELKNKWNKNVEKEETLNASRRFAWLKFSLKETTSEAFKRSNFNSAIANINKTIDRQVSISFNAIATSVIRSVISEVKAKSNEEF